MGLKENSSILSNIYDAFKDTFITEFSFFDEALIDPTVYSLVLEVKSNRCEHGLLVDENLELGGKLQWRSVAQEDLDVRIDQEDFTTKPGVMIPDGDVINNIQSDTIIDKYVTDIAFEFEGGEFEDDKEWFLSFEEGQKD